MFYFNTVSKEVKLLSDLAAQENASIGEGLTYGQWVPVTIDPYPENQEGKVYEFGDIEMRGDRAFRTWVEVPAAPVDTPV